MPTSSLTSSDKRHSLGYAAGASLRAVVASVGLMLIAANFGLGFGVTSAWIGVLITCPFWLGGVLHRTDLRWILVCLLAILASGAILVIFAPYGRNYIASQGFFICFLVVIGIASIFVIRWSRTVLSLAGVLFSFAAGLLASSESLFRDGFKEVFKFGLALPLALCVCAILSKRSKLSSFALYLVAVVGILCGARSFSVFVAAAASLYLLGRAARRWRYPRVFLISLAIIVVPVAYSGVTYLLVSGYLGSDNMARSRSQVAETGSLILGARPEWSATWGIMQHNIWGYGPGAVPNRGDYSAGRAGLIQLGIDGRGPYYTDYMFGGHFKLHSIIADLWVSFGLIGLSVGIVSMGFLLWRLLDLTARGFEGNPAQIFVGLTGVWFLAFGPISSDIGLVALAIGLCLPVPKPERCGTSASAHAHAHDGVVSDSRREHSPRTMGYPGV